MPFSEATTRWFNASFPGPTSAQVGAWDSIAKGDNTLVVAPTGSGKTLSAFLWAIDRLASRHKNENKEDEPAGVQVLYISPMKALGVDVERNLRSPLAGVTQSALSLGLDAPQISVGVRSGDTSPQQRRRITTHPPDILITTPESLYLMLTSAASEVLASIETVIVDEVHAMAANKRGAHLSLSLERLDAILPKPAQRIGLSATVRPPQEVARFLGGTSSVTIVSPPNKPAFDITVEVPAQDMTDPPLPLATETDREAEHRLGSMWPSIEQSLYQRVMAEHSTIVFANSRRLAERLTNRLNEIHQQTIGTDDLLARVHHGSVSKEQREDVEEALKSGQLRCVVSTSSLELGIDMGLVDQVVQVDAPPSVSSGLQRIGRAGHHVGGVSRAVIYPTHRSKLLEVAGVVQRMREGDIETMRVLANPLDVLAQQTVAAVAMRDWNIDEWYRTVTRAAPYQSLPRSAFDATIDLLAGRYPSTEFAQLRPRLVWDRDSGTLSARPGSQRLAVTQGGTIPDRGLFRVVTAGEGDERSRVGELDEEMVYESRVGEVFTLGTTSWRIKEITKDTVQVVPAFGVPGKMPFWRGDSPSRPHELGQGIGELTGQIDRELQAGHWESASAELTGIGFDHFAAENTLAYVQEQREVAGVVPSDGSLLIEQTRDEVGDWRLVLQSPYGLAVHAPWALALGARVREQLGLEASAVASNDGIIVRLPDTEDDPPGPELFAFDPDEISAIVLDEITNSPLFAARFRECAARSLILGAGKPGKRSPLWQQRQRSASLLEVASRYPSFPVILEAVRECVQDVYDLDALTEIHRRLTDGRIRMRQSVTETPSPFAQAMLFGYVGAFLYEGDAPAGERRLAALSVDPTLLRELLGDVEMADILEQDAITQVELELQRLAAERRLSGSEGVADLLRTLGPLDLTEISNRIVDPSDEHSPLPAEQANKLVEELVETRRIIPVRIADQQRYAVIEDAGLLQQGLGIALPPGVPSVFLQLQADALTQLLSRYGTTHGPFTAAQAGERFGLGSAVVTQELTRLSQRRAFLEGRFTTRGDSAQSEWISVDVLRRIRSRSIALLRGSVEAVPQDVYASFLLNWQGVSDPSTGLDGLEAALELLDGLPLPASTWETMVLPVRVRDYRPSDLDALIGSGQVLWVGGGQLAKTDGWVSFHMRETAALTLPEPQAPDAGRESAIVKVLSDKGALFAPQLLEELREEYPLLSVAELAEALWSLAWKSLVTTDSPESLRAAIRGRRAAQKTSPSRGRPRRLRASFLSRVAVGTDAAAVMLEARLAGRWSMLPRPEPGEQQRFMAKVALLLDRYAIVTRGAVTAEPVSGGFSRAYGVLSELESAGLCRRGYLVEGLGGAQFAASGTVDRLRDYADQLASEGPGATRKAVVLSATDPANPYGAVLPWPELSGAEAVPETLKPRRNPGALVVLMNGHVCFYLERGGRTAADLVSTQLSAAEVEEMRQLCSGALARALAEARLNSFTLQKINGKPVTDSEWESPLLDAGFELKPKGLIWRKRAI